jgi:hypothetical protein
MQEIHTDLQKLGGSGMGFGGGDFSNSPLLWLITLGFLGRNGGLFGGNDAQGTAAVANTTGIAENSAKIDCLAQGQSHLQNSISANADMARFDSLSAQLRAISETERDIQESQFRTTQAIEAQLAECCCRLEKGQQEIQTAIALQTNTLTMNANDNTQKILDNLCSSRIDDLRAQNDNLQRQLSVSETVKQVLAGLPGGHGRGLVA